MKKLTDQEIYEIYKKATEEKISTTKLAEEYGTSVSTVNRIKFLKYPKYKKIIEMYSKTYSNDNNTKIESKKDINSLQEKIENMNKEVFISDILRILADIYTPFILKIIYDDILNSEKISKLIDKSIQLIKQEKSEEFYIETIKTFIAGLHLQILKPDIVESIYRTLYGAEIKK